MICSDYEPSRALAMCPTRDLVRERGWMQRVRNELILSLHEGDLHCECEFKYRR